WGLRPKARMLWLLAKSFARCKTNRASNKRHPFLYNQEVYLQSVFIKIEQILNPYPQTPFPRKGAILLGLPQSKDALVACQKFCTMQN
ncbi:hypothetical protein EUBSIR_00493, partial [[Eubacterium] siraeum DSM 15702]